MEARRADFQMAKDSRKLCMYSIAVALLLVSITEVLPSKQFFPIRATPKWFVSEHLSTFFNAL